MSPYICEPWWDPIPISLDTQDKAIRRHDEILLSGTHTGIYTDGNGIGGKIGAAAVIPALGRTKRAYLGLESELTVYSAELYGICMALWMCLDLYTSPKKVAIFTDNQAAILASHQPRISTGQYLTHLIVNLTKELRTQGFEIEIHWIPAHIGITGNEMADKAAKEATGHENYPRADMPLGLMVLKSSLRQRLRNLIKERWKADWLREQRGRMLHRLIEEPTAKVLSLHDGLHKAVSSAIVQMRTGKIALNDFLYRIKAQESDRCRCGDGPQTVWHLLLQSAPDAPAGGDESLRHLVIEFENHTEYAGASRKGSTLYDCIWSIE